MKDAIKKITAILLVMCFTGIVTADDWKKESEDVILQGFHWNSHTTKPWWGVIESKAAEIAKAGFTMVWFPPSSAAASKEGYLPHQLYLQNSNYGSQQQLQSAIKNLHKHNVKAIADIVINHRVGTKNWADFTNPDWGSDAVCRDDEWQGAKGNFDTGDRYGAARDLDHTKEYVQKSIIEWMLWLKNTIGYDGVRYDYVKGYAAKYNKIYNEAMQPSFSVGELWDNLDVNNPDPHRQQLCDWIDDSDATSAAFDFTTKGILQLAVRNSEYWRLRDNNGKPVGLIGWWPQRAVTFIDNHDTGPSPDGGQNHWPFPGEKLMQGYCYILTHPGIPCVYWVHYFDWPQGKEIAKLIQLRKEHHISSVSKVDIQKADSGVYAAIIDGKVAMKIGGGNWSPGSDWKLSTSGNGYAVWTK
ncbi:alpha-amylase C-terminal beta-sheet domain-containing protein [Candidatus Uabimicrobium amorphum]|uniref:Alpha-amylase n=1 Tax=Uabimicrobium amorphum TaxID=2596890 RepID=A0A5S9F671_UABAM|nr:alpha-amylase C-terminal beta-sheet domain-containing protein [Candidatus Uabimicrobium amorphum]BBM87576.1 alpha-amylase [Candidatus Uabimicrobium amorphum]